VYKRDYTFRMNVMEEIFEIRSCIEILANDIKVNTADEYICSTVSWHKHTGVNSAGDAGDTSPPKFWLVGTSMGISPPIFLRTFGYSRPALVALCSLKRICFGHKMPHCRQFASVTHVDTRQWSGLTRLQQSVHCKKAGQTVLWLTEWLNRPALLLALTVS